MQKKLESFRENSNVEKSEKFLSLDKKLNATRNRRATNESVLETSVEIFILCLLSVLF